MAGPDRNERALIAAILEHTVCSKGCGIRLATWSGGPADKPWPNFVFGCEHRDHRLPIVIPKDGASDLQMEHFEALVANWQHLAPGWHANPGSEEDWRKELSA